MQCVVDTELHNAPRASDAELSRKKERLIELVSNLPAELVKQIDEIIDRVVSANRSDNRK